MGTTDANGIYTPDVDETGWDDEMATTLGLLSATITDLETHEADAAAAHAASAVAFTPEGAIAATNVQAAIVEVASEAIAAPDIGNVFTTGDPTGAAGSAAALQALIDAIPASGSAGVPAQTIWFGPGTWAIEEPLYIVKKAIIFRGTGVGNPTNYATPGAGSTLMWTGESYVDIATATHSGSTVTITTSSAHGFTTGDRITIADVTDSTSTILVSTTYNGAFVITVTGATTFTYTAVSAPTVDADASTGVAGPSMFVIEDGMHSYFSDIYFQGSTASPPVDLLYFNSAGGSAGTNAFQGARDCRFGGWYWTTPATHATMAAPRTKVALNGVRFGGRGANNDQFNFKDCNFSRLTNGFVADTGQSIWGYLLSPELEQCDSGVRTASNMLLINPQFVTCEAADLQINSTASVDVVEWVSEGATLFLDMPATASGASCNVFGGKWLVATGYVGANMTSLLAFGEVSFKGVNFDKGGNANLPKLYARTQSADSGSLSIIDCKKIKYTDLDIAAGASTSSLVVRLDSGDEIRGDMHGRFVLTAGAALPTTQAWQYNGQNVVIGKAALATTATDGFLYLPTCAGAPTGVPTTKTGTVPIVFDTTNNKLYLYDGGWLYVGVS